MVIDDQIGRAGRAADHAQRTGQIGEVLAGGRDVVRAGAAGRIDGDGDVRGGRFHVDDGAGPSVEGDALHAPVGDQGGGQGLHGGVRDSAGLAGTVEQVIEDQRRGAAGAARYRQGAGDITEVLADRRDVDRAGAAT